MTPNRITRLVAWAKRVDWVYMAGAALAVGVFIVLVLWIIALTLSLAGYEPKPQPKPTASIPAIPKVDFNAADRAMIQQIHAWVEDQKEAKADFERDMKAGRIPRLPGVGR